MERNDFLIKSRKFNKALYFVFSIVLFLLALSTYIDLKSKYLQLEEHLDTLEKMVIVEYTDRLKESLSTSIYFIDELYKSYLQKNEKNRSKLNEEEYKDFENRVRKYFYENIHDKARYSWINQVKNFEGGDNYAVRLIHPNLKNTEGKLLSTNMKDKKGNKPYQIELDGINKNGEVLYSYFFKQYNRDTITKKISYAKLYKELNWIVATGIPFDILHEKISLLKNVHIEDYTNYMYVTLVINFLIIMIMVFTLYFLRNRTTQYLFSSLLNTNKNLKQSNEKLLEATKSAHIGVWKWDIQKNKLEWNSEMYGLYELDENETNDNYELWSNSLHPEDKKNAQELLMSAVEKRINFSTIFKIKVKSGIKYIKATGKPFYDDNKKPIYVIGTNFDITKFKLYETQQIQLLEQSKLASLGEMIGNIAHQWRQPLSVINTASSGLKIQKEAGILTDELFFNELNTISSNVHYLDETIETFRNFLKEEKIYEETIVQERIKKTLEIIDSTLKYHQIELIHNLDDVEDIKIKIVIGELSQVILNILNNSKDAFKENNISNPKIIINVENKKDSVLITVEDNAGGIPEEIISKIFDPYFSTKHQSIGTGLGLYMSYKIITESLKGKLYVKNKNDGAKFYIELFHN